MIAALAQTPARRVLCTGVFDLFHIGHLRYLQYARRQGTHLTVAVTPDALCAERKGKWPVIEEAQRLEIIRALGWADRAEYMPSSLDLTNVAVAWMTEWAIKHVVVGGEWEGTARWLCLIPALAEQGITVSFAPHTHGISTTQIVQRIVQREGLNS